MRRWERRRLTADRSQIQEANYGLWMMDYGLWSPELARGPSTSWGVQWNPDLGQGFVIVSAPACRQAGSSLCDGKVVSELALKKASRRYVGVRLRILGLGKASFATTKSVNDKFVATPACRQIGQAGNVGRETGGFFYFINYFCFFCQ